MTSETTQSTTAKTSSKSIVSSGIWVFAVQILGTCIGLLAHIFVSTTVGDSEYGTYTFLLSGMEILTVVSVLGMNNAVMRYYSTYVGPEHAGHRVGLRRFSRLFVLACSIASLSIVLLGYFLVGATNEESSSFGKTLLIGACAVLVISQNAISSALLRARRQPVIAMALPNLGRPFFLLLVFAVVVLWFVQTPNASHAMLAYFIATLTVGAVGLAILATSSWRDPEDHAKPEYEVREWSLCAASLAMASGFRIAMDQCNILMVGFFVDLSSVGHYSAAVRLANLTTFGLTATNFVVAPMIAAAYSRGKIDELQANLRTAAKFILLISLPIVVGILAIGPWILTRWGEDFLQAYPCLVILVVSQLINACCGCVGYLLAMSGHERMATKILGSAVLVNISFNVILVPAFGIYGAALASLVTTVFWNAWMLVFVNRKMQVNPTIFSFLNNATRKS